jgi:hypothetical protein
LIVSLEKRLNASCDSLLILTDLTVKAGLIAEPRFHTKKTIRKADWDIYRSSIVTAANNALDGDASLSAIRLAKIILAAAIAAVFCGSRRNAKLQTRGSVMKPSNLWIRHMRLEECDCAIWTTLLVHETFRDADKAACYNNFVAGLDIQLDPARPSRVLKDIDSASGNPSNYALTSGAKTVSTPQAKINLANQHYAPIII